MTETQYTFMDKQKAVTDAVTEANDSGDDGIIEVTNWIATEEDAMKAIETLMTFIGADMDY